MTGMAKTQAAMAQLASYQAYSGCGNDEQRYRLLPIHATT
jgi:hypothetical protein